MKFFERIKNIFFRSKHQALPESINADKIILLTKKERDPEKVLNILRNYCALLQSSEISQIIYNLPANKRVEGIEIAQKYLTPYDIYDIALKKIDYIGKLEILEKFQYRLDLEDIFQLFNNLPPDQRTNALNKCIDRFDSYSLSEAIKNYIPLYERLECLNLYQDRLDGFSKASIISNLDSQRKIDALRKYEKELNKTDLNDIICQTETSMVAKVLDIVYNELTQQQIADIIQYNIPKEQRLETLYKCCYKLDSSTIADLIKHAIPEEQKEEALVSLQNRIKSNNIGEIIQFCLKSAKVLDKVKNNLDPEDVEFFSNNQ